MTPTETAALLQRIAGIDNRKVTTEAADEWAATLDSRIRPEDALWLARRHFSTSDEYLTPNRINSAYREIRRQRVRDMRAEPPPPDDLDPRQAIAWSKAYVEGIANGASEDDADARACQQLNTTRREIGPDVHGRVRDLIDGATATLTEGASA